EHRGPLRQKRLDPFRVVFAVIHQTPQSLDPLEGIGTQGVGARQKPYLLLDDADTQRTVTGDLPGQIVGEFLQFLNRDQMVENSQFFCLFGTHGLGGEEHLFGDIGPHDVDKVKYTGGVVGYSDLGRSHAETCGRSADQDVTGKSQIARSSPDTPLDHGDYWQRYALNLPEDRDERVAVGKRIAPR